MHYVESPGAFSHFTIGLTHMQKREIEIRNRLGLHARASAKLVQIALHFRSQVTLEYAGRRANARSIVAVMLLAVSMGSTIVLEAEGPDETDAMKAMVTLINAGFGEHH